jgi:hypothetical protein
LENVEEGEMAHAMLLAASLFLAAGNTGSPELLRPSDKATIPLGEARDQSITFMWQATAGSPTYRFRIAATEDFKRPILDRKTEQIFEKVRGLRAGRWFWKISVLDAAGNDVSSSATGSFSVE